ncbi:liver-expressed antimicrobial peptide 2 [Eleutherodactylus coqui]|uniref:Liver-expressed antimicrobial peptide 2 n=1 Tax=Eleutherodactylus coqui TaxID=57060 RepID=A0A8J6FML7_ELECQ|nr:hypothetical protein GDO78_006195 [Eleutherodactylus coqui]
MLLQRSIGLFRVTMRGQLGKWTACLVLCALLVLQVEAAPLHNDCPKTAVRAKRMTPFWRTMAMRPVGAYCRDDIECFTGLCRNRRCCLKTFED